MGKKERGRCGLYAHIYALFPRNNGGNLKRKYMLEELFEWKTVLPCVGEVTLIIIDF